MSSYVFEKIPQVFRKYFLQYLEKSVLTKLEKKYGKSKQKSLKFLFSSTLTCYI